MAKSLESCLLFFPFIQFSNCDVLACEQIEFFFLSFKSYNRWYGLSNFSKKKKKKKGAPVTVHCHKIKSSYLLNNTSYRWSGSAVCDEESWRGLDSTLIKLGKQRRKKKKKSKWRWSLFTKLRHILFINSELYIEIRASSSLFTASWEMNGFAWA